MRLSDVLSKPPKNDYIQVEGFLVNKKGKIGQKVNLSVGKVALNYFCKDCDDLRTFQSQGELSCIFVDKQIVSIDCVLQCVCGATVQAWFLVECDNDITSENPKVRIIKKSERLSYNVQINTNSYGNISYLLDKAQQAYYDELGAGSIVYLRKIFEMITVKTANAVGIEYDKYEGGNPKNFSKLLEKVDSQCEIVPKEFSANRYKLFRELSTIVHGDFDEDSGLKKFEPLYRLIIGILENVKNKEEFKDAIKSLEWDKQ